MIIVLHVRNYYDWEKSDKPGTKEEQVAGLVKQDAAGATLRKVTKSAAEFPNGVNQTTFVIPESEIKNLSDHFERLGEAWPRTREQIACWKVSKDLRHHASPEHIVAVEAHDDLAENPSNPPLKAALESFFEVEKNKAVVAAPAPVAPAPAPAPTPEGPK